MNKKGFTLIELLVVIAIIGVLSGFVVIRMNGAINAANDAKKQADLASIKKALIIYGIENGNNYPVVESGCTIGSCPTLDNAVQNILPTNLNGTYTYQSNATGSSFEAATVLSSGYAYTYDSVTNTFENKQPSNGACGTANKTYSSTDTSYSSDTFCSVGTVSPTTPVFPSANTPTTWTCSGVNGGNNASCTAIMSFNGVCGASNNSNLSTQPSTNLCNQGTASAVSGSGPWTWDCAGSSGGSNASCSTGALPVNGVCGAANNSNLSTQPSTNLCNQGTASAVSGSGPWTWDCSGTNSGNSASCSANLILNGSCGTANGSNSYTAPSTNLCAAGTASVVSGSGPWNWSCAGTNSGTTASCSAVKKIDGVCGTASKAYSSSSSSYGSDTFCATGATSPTAPSFPAQGASTSWTCSGTNSGVNASCSASKNVAATCPSGATCSTVSSDYIIKWTTVGSSSWTIPNGVSSVQYLVLAGGGGGGCAGGGGGAGGLLSGNLSVSAGTATTITVGAGGGGGSGGYDAAYRGSNGGNSSFVHSSTSLIAVGGGAGGSFNPSTYPGVNGGSGGGGQIERSATAYGAGGTATSGQGNNGGASSSTSSSSGGGGGAGGIGGTGVGSVAGNGGVGISSSITGTATWYAGGGGGGSHNIYTPGTATSGGGNGGKSGGGSSATANTGGGGGGGGLADGGNRYGGGNGGSGIVIVRFANP